MNELTELKNCPFCGGKAIYRAAPNNNVRVVCQGCSMKTTKVYYEWSSKGYKEGCDKVASLWNRRQ